MTLQRPPPEIFTLPSVWLLFSRITTRAPGQASAQAMAAKNPAAPPPATMRSQGAELELAEFGFKRRRDCGKGMNPATQELDVSGELRGIGVEPEGRTHPPRS